MNILLLEDDLMVGKALLQSLQRRQWQVQWLRRAADAQERLKTEAFDLLLLDLGLPIRVFHSYSIIPFKSFLQNFTVDSVM